MVGVIVDKFGGIYDQVGGDLSISDNVIPVGATVKVITFPNIPNDSNSAELIKESIKGGSIGVSATYNYINWSTGVAIPSSLDDFSSQNQSIHFDTGVTTTAHGISTFGGYSSYVGNLSDADIWGSDYNTNVLKYFYDHPNSGLELYNGSAGKLVLIRCRPFGAEIYDGYGAFHHFKGFDEYSNKMHWRRY